MIVLPSGNLDSISWLSAEIVFYVIDDNGLLQVSSNSTQILNVEVGTVIFDFVGVVAVKTIRDENAVLVKVVKNLICIVLFSSCEYVKLIVLRKLSEEFFSGRSNVEHHF